MKGLVRSSAVGQILRWITGTRVLQYPDERSDFKCSACYTDAAAPDILFRDEQESDPNQVSRTHSLERAQTAPVGEYSVDRVSQTDRSFSIPTSPTRIPTIADLEKVHTRADLEQLYLIATQKEEFRDFHDQPIAPVKTSDGTVLVDWYSTQDPENPQNWSSGRKFLVVVQIYLYTLAVYMGSSIYSPSTSYVQERFGVSEMAASLGLALYVLGYGVGPLIFAPLSEIPRIGRNPVYIITFAIFVILGIPTAVVDNFGGLLVLPRSFWKRIFKHLARL